MINPLQAELPGKQLREQRLRWQSRVVLLLVLPLAFLYLADHLFFALYLPSTANTITALGLSTIFALLVWRLRAATGAAATCGGLLTACIDFGTIPSSATSWVHSGIVPLLTLFVLTYLATKYRRTAKERQGTAGRQGTAERQGRNAAQVCANLGVAALIQAPFIFTRYYSVMRIGSSWLAPMLAALAEATADTVSSEVGQVLGGTPRMLTTLRAVAPGTDGAISIAGTGAGCLAAAIVVSVAALSMRLDLRTCILAFACGIFGLFFDSLLGATLERRGYLNNDAVNFLSTLAAAAVAILIAWK